MLCRCGRGSPKTRLPFDQFLHAVDLSNPEYHGAAPASHRYLEFSSGMNEHDFWINLQYRVSEEFRGLPDKRHRAIWCDGFEPKHYNFEAVPPRFTGKAYMYVGSSGAVWKFELTLPSTATSTDNIPWATLLPDSTLTYWMSFDEEDKRLDLDPAAARLPEP